MLFNEPKLLKSKRAGLVASQRNRFSALQRAEIAEMNEPYAAAALLLSFSALQRAEIAEILPPLPAPPVSQIPIPARRRS